MERCFSVFKFFLVLTQKRVLMRSEADLINHILADIIDITPY